VIQPTLFIGLGGSGGKTLRAIRETIGEELARQGWCGDFPRAIKFLHIDLDLVNGQPKFQSPKLSDSEVCNLAPFGLTYDSVRRCLESTLDSDDERAELFGDWLLWEARLDYNVGSGGIRPLGRSVFFHSLSRVLQHVDLLVAEINSGSSIAELAEILRSTTSDAIGIDQFDSRIAIVASLCGGTGSSIYVDLLEILRIRFPGPLGEKPVSFLYDAATFANLPPRYADLLFGNMITTIDEISNYALNGHGAASSKLLTRMGVPQGPPDYRDNSLKIVITDLSPSRAIDDHYFLLGQKIANEVLDSNLRSHLFLVSPEAVEVDIDQPASHSNIFAPHVTDFSATLLNVPHDLIQDQKPKGQNDTEALYENSTISASLSNWIHNFKSLDPAARSELVKARKVRPVSESIPITKAAIEKLAIGWLVARLFGLVQMSDIVVIRIPEIDSPLEWPELPTVIPSNSVKHRDSDLTQILSNFSFALRMDDVEAYSYLFRLGQHIVAYSESSSEEEVVSTDLIRRYIFDLMPTDTTLQPLIFGSNLPKPQSTEARRQQVLDAVRLLSATIAETFVVNQSENWYDRGELSLHFENLSALHNIERYAATVMQPTVGEMVFMAEDSIGGSPESYEELPSIGEVQSERR